MRTKLATVIPVDIVVLPTTVAKPPECSDVAKPTEDLRLPLADSALSSSSAVDTHAAPCASSSSENRPNPDAIGSAEKPAAHQYRRRDLELDVAHAPGH